MFIVIWNIRAKINFFGGNSQFLTALCGHIITFLIPALFILLLAGLILLLGTPYRAKLTADNLSQIGLVSQGFSPALVSRNHVKNTDVSVLVFYSLGVSKELWEKQQAAVQDVLNIHFVEPIKYGGRKETNRNLIVLTVSPGASGIGRREKLYDDEL